MQAVRSHHEIRDVNTRYHDVAAAAYDAKWGIDFGDVAQAQVLRKLQKLGHPPTAPRFERALEIGAGTGYFGLNLKAAGMIDELTCTDISSGMVEVLGDNAARLGFEGVRAITAEAESLPFEDNSFDVVLGHAILHHIPELDRAFAEFHRVLRPGGRLFFAGEPSRTGDRLARLPKRAAQLAAPAWRALVGASAAAARSDEDDLHGGLDHRLESEVDIHVFAPADLRRVISGAGFDDVDVRGEELLANWFGWFNRGLEATATDAEVPMLWRRYAFHGYLLLQRLDRWALEPRLPASVFYNLLVTGRRP